MLANQLSQAAAVIQHGGVVAYSTDTIIGLGCDPYNRSAVECVLWLKQRSIEKGLILLTEGLDGLKDFSQPLTSSQCSKITSTRAPTTWLLPKSSSTPVWITGIHASVAMRVTQHPIASQLCKSTEAIVSTSANFSDYPTATNQQQLKDWFGPHLDYVIIDATGTGLPSEVRDLISGETLRQIW